MYWRTSVARIANTGYASLTILAIEVRQYVALIFTNHYKLHNIMMKQIFTTLLFLIIMTSVSLAQSIRIGGTLSTSIDLLEAPKENSEITFIVNGSGFTAYPALYVLLDDSRSISIEAGAGISFMRKNNINGEVDNDAMFSFPVLAKMNFGSASNTGNDCGLAGWYLGVGRQHRTAIQIHGTTTTAFNTYFGEIGGTVNAGSPIAIGLFGRLGFGANNTRAGHIGLTFTYAHVKSQCAK